jgi:hypothetical protein
MCNACSDENFDSASEDNFRRPELSPKSAFAPGSGLRRKHYRTHFGARASRIFGRIARLRGLIEGGTSDCREVAFYRGKRFPLSSREPEEIFVSSDVIVEIHRGERGAKNRTQSSIPKGGGNGWR